LSLTHLSCDDDVLSDLVRSPRLRHLRRLQLRGSLLGMRAIRALAEEGPPGLTSLQIDLTHPDADAAVEALATSPHVPWLTFLDLGLPRLGERGMRPLLEGPPRLCVGGLDHRMKDSPLFAAYRERFGRVFWRHQLPDAIADQ